MRVARARHNDDAEVLQCRVYAINKYRLYSHNKKELRRRRAKHIVNEMPIKNHSLHYPSGDPASKKT